jgi:membrane protein EpsK
MNNSNHKQFFRNLISNGSLFIVNIVIGIWLTPYLILRLGVEVYGMVPLANQITTYLSLLTLVLTGASGRFLSIAIIREDNEEANKVFNTTFYASLLLTIGLLPFLFVFIFFVPAFLNVPVGFEQDTQLLFAFIFLAALITFLQTSFLVPSWSKNRIDLRNNVILLGKICQIFFIIIAFKVFPNRVWLFGASVFISYAITTFGIFFVNRKLTPSLYISTKYFDRLWLKEIIGLGKWIVVDQIGSILLLNSDLFMANQLLGPTIGGEYGSLVLIPQTIRVFVSTLSSTVSPVQMEKFANGYTGEVTYISRGTVKILSIFLAIIIGSLCGFSKELLNIWLGNDFVHLQNLLILLLIPLFFTLPFQPLFQLQIAYKKVKLPAIAVLTFGVMNIALAFLFIKVFHLGAEGIALAFGISYSIRTTIFTPIYGAIIQKMPLGTYLTSITPSCSLLIFVILLITCLKQIIKANSMTSYLFILLVSTCLSLIGGYLLLTKNEKESMKVLVKRK